MASEPTMPFGKYKGRKLAEVPHGYVRYILGNMELREPLKSQLRAVLDGQPVRTPPDEDELIARLFTNEKEKA